MKKTVLIFGVTQGLGKALAKYYLNQGHYVIGCARYLKRLDDLKDEFSLELDLYHVDVTSYEQVQNFYQQIEQRIIDIVIITAGFYASNRHIGINKESTQKLLKTNISALTYIIDGVSQKLMKQEHGHIVMFSSMATLLNSYHVSELYTSTKKTILSLAHSYRIALKDFGIYVTCFLPGYINTEGLKEIAESDKSTRPFVLSEEQAIKRITKDIFLKKRDVIFPLRMRILVFFLNFIPVKIFKLFK